MKFVISYKRAAIAAVSTMMLLSITACGTKQQGGQDYYYSSNVNPQFTPSAPLDEDNSAMNGETTDNIMMNRIHSQSANKKGNHSKFDLMMNGQAMTEQQQKVMNKIRKIQGVTDASVIINDKSKRIYVGLDVSNVGRRDAVVNDVHYLLEQEYADYEVEVTARRASYDRIRSMNSDDTNNSDNESITRNATNRLHNLTDDLRDFFRDIRESVTEPLRQ